MNYHFKVEHLHIKAQQVIVYLIHKILKIMNKKIINVTTMNQVNNLITKLYNI